MKRLLKFLCMVCLMTATTLPAVATLPTGYTELEYIESTGTQYIDTGLTVKSNTLADFDYQYTDCTNKNYVFGQVSGNATSIMGYRTDRIWWFAKKDLSNGCDLNKHTVSFASDGKVYKDGNILATRGTFGSIQSNLFMKLFAELNDGGQINIGRVKIYHFAFKEGSTVVRDFISAKNSSGVVGMYDTVNNVFYTNKGSGTFVAGPIACNGTRMNYTTTTGTVVQNGTPTPTNPIEPVFYKQGDMVLRKVGDYADSYDATTGKITRRVGVKVLDGTEAWFYRVDAPGNDYLGNMYNLVINDIFTETMSVTTNRQSPYCTHFARSTDWLANSADNRLNKLQAYISPSGTPILGLGYPDVSDANIPTFKAWLAAQYANGTPVTVYYPLATSVEEDWAAEQCIVSDGIKIATTKYTEDAFAGLMTTLSEAITKVTNIVDTTVQQATEIGNLATTKQDRPDTDCPAGRKCLLIMGADNKPHWYLIQE